MSPASTDRALGRPAPEVTFDELLERAQALIGLGGRRLLGICGAPGAGKSTAAAALAAALGEQAVLVGMDGFHLANSELTRLGRRDRKGAPDTFDADGYVALLQRLRHQGPELLYAPTFNRAIEESIGSAVPVHRDTPLVITEGNYLLLEEHGWAGVHEALDEVWYLDVAPGVRIERLVNRRRSFGDTADHAEAWVHDVDQANAGVVEASREHADLLVHLTTRLPGPGAPPAAARPHDESRGAALPAPRVAGSASPRSS